MKRCTVCGSPAVRAGVCSVVCRVLSHCSGREDPDGCWNWEGAVRNHYGVIRVKQDGRRWSTRNVHRVVFAEMLKDVPHGYSVTHTCGSKLCCNPKHLQLKIQPFYLGASDEIRVDVAA